MNSAAAAQKWLASLLISNYGTDFSIRNSSAPSQEVSSGVGYAASTEDSTGALTLDITLTLGTASANLTVEKEIALLELIPPV
jgi:hypothetical protein